MDDDDDVFWLCDAANEVLIYIERIKRDRDKKLSHMHFDSLSMSGERLKSALSKVSKKKDRNNEKTNSM